MKGMTLGAIATIALAVIVLTGMVLVAEYSLLLRQSTIPAADVNIASVSNSTSTRVGTSGQYPFLQAATSCHNETDASDTLTYLTDYVIDDGDKNGGYILLLPTATGNRFNGADINCTITYLADTTSQASADKFNTGLAVFGTFMAVIVLALVGKVIVGIFIKK